jgi:hypothetical protein
MVLFVSSLCWCLMVYLIFLKFFHILGYNTKVLNKAGINLLFGKILLLVCTFTLQNKHVKYVSAENKRCQPVEKGYCSQNPYPTNFSVWEWNMLTFPREPDNIFLLLWEKSLREYLDQTCEWHPENVVQWRTVQIYEDIAVILYHFRAAPGHTDDHHCNDLLVIHEFRTWQAYNYHTQHMICVPIQYHWYNYDPCTQPWWVHCRSLGLHI